MRETITPIFSYPQVIGLQRCATFSPNKSVHIGSFNAVWHFFNESLTDTLYIWLHEMGDFFPTYSKLYGSNFVQVNMDRDAEPSQYFAIEALLKDKKSLSTDNNPCIGHDQDPQISQCLLNHYEDKLACKLPWNRKHMKGFDLCQTEEQFNMYIKMSGKDFSSTSEAEIFKRTGCKPRCFQRHYFDNKISNGNFPYGSNRDGLIFAAFIKSGEFVYEEEVYVYQWLDFIADIGGYLGLWLGFSALSICDSLTRKLLSKART